MAIYLWANNATTTLASPISSAATSLNVASGTGALFPNPTGSEIFTLTLSDAATGLINEIMVVTAISGDTMTVVRGQENTTAIDWAAGSIAQNLITAGSLASLAPDQQSGAGWQRLPGGRILQWGQHTNAGTTDTVSLPIPFPNNFYTINMTNDGPNGDPFGASPNGLSAFFSYTLTPGNGGWWQAIGD